MFPIVNSNGQLLRSITNGKAIYGVPEVCGYKKAKFSTPGKWVKEIAVEAGREECGYGPMEVNPDTIYAYMFESRDRIEGSTNRSAVMTGKIDGQWRVDSVGGRHVYAENTIVTWTTGIAPPQY